MDYDSNQRRHRHGHRHGHSHGWQGFTFLGGSINEVTPVLDRKGESSAAFAEVGESFPLSSAQQGDRLWIIGFTAGESLLERFVSMGLSRGTELEVISRGSGGSILIAFANTRLGLGAGMAAKIRVQRSAIPVTDPQPLGQDASKEPSTEHRIQEKPMQTRLHLRDMAVGSQGRITGYGEGAASYRQQLLAMGLTPGIEFTVTRQAPLGDPVELHVRGFELSLRKAEADALIVELINHA